MFNKDSDLPDGEWVYMFALKEHGIPVYNVGNAKSKMSSMRQLNQLGIPSLVIDEKSVNDQPTISFGIQAIRGLLSEHFPFSIEQLDYNGKPYLDEGTQEVVGFSEGYSYIIKEIRVHGTGSSEEEAKKDLINNLIKYTGDYFSPKNISFFLHPKSGSAHHYGWLLRIIIETGLEEKRIKEFLGL